MDLELRPVGDAEFAAYSRAVSNAFGSHSTEEEVDEWRSMCELDRTLAVFDDGQIVGTAGAFSFDLTLPGSRVVQVPGVTAVGVRNTHRRRGLLRMLMERQLDDIAARGESLAILTASESLIYGRFGYGTATYSASVSIDTRHSAFRPSFTDQGTVRLVDPAEARTALPAIHDRARALQPGDISRPSAWWDVVLRDPERHRGGASGAFYAVHRSPTGQDDGWATYRVRAERADGVAANTIEVVDMGATSATAELGLWRLLFDTDLVARVVAPSRPTDEPLRHWLVDPRRLVVAGLHDHVWVRLLDVAAALAARRYRTEDELVIEVVDGFRPQTGGRYRLVGGPDGAECRRADAANPDLTLDVAALASGYLGAPRFCTMARAGLVDEHRHGAARAAELMFGSDVVPFCRTGF